MFASFLFAAKQSLMLLIVLRAYKKPFQSELKFLQKLKFKYDFVLNPFFTNLTVT